MVKRNPLKVKWRKSSDGLGVYLRCIVGKFELLVWKSKGDGFEGAIYSRHSVAGRKVLSSAYPDTYLSGKSLDEVKERLTAIFHLIAKQEISTLSQFVRMIEK